MLEIDVDAAARGVLDGLFGLAVEVVVLQAAMGRSQGGEVGIREAARVIHPPVRHRRTGAPQRGQGASLEPLAKRSNAVSGVLADSVAVETAKNGQCGGAERASVPTGALTRDQSEHSKGGGAPQ